MSTLQAPPLVVYAQYLDHYQRLLSEPHQQPVDEQLVLRDCAQQGCTTMAHYVNDPTAVVLISTTVLGLSRAADRRIPALPSLVQARNRVIDLTRKYGFRLPTELDHLVDEAVWRAHRSAKPV